MNMNEKKIQKQKALPSKWKRITVGKNATVYLRALDPHIIKELPHETNTFLDYSPQQILFLRTKQQFSKLGDFLKIHR